MNTTRKSLELRRATVMVGAVLPFGLLAIAACSAAPDEPRDRAEATASTTSALDPIGGMPPTTYKFTLNQVHIEAMEPQPAKTNDKGYVVWAGLSTQVGPREPDFAGCTLGSPAGFAATLVNCQAGGASFPGQPLWRTATVTSPNDQVILNFALDNIEAIDLSAGAPSGTGTLLQQIGGGMQTYGALVAVIDPEAAPFSGTVSFLGSGVSLLGSVWQSHPPAKISCAGGLLGDPATPGGIPTDLRTTTFTGKDLAALTAGGPTWLGIFKTLQWNDGCWSEVVLEIGIERLWVDGLAAFPKSADNAVVRNEGNVDIFTPNLAYHGIEHLSTSGGASGAWRSELVNGLQYVYDPDMPIAAVSRTPGSEDIFYVDGYGDWSGAGGIKWASWIAETAAWTTRSIYPIKGINRSVPVTAVARSTNNLDVFFANAAGGIETSWWSTGKSDFTTVPLTGDGATRSSAGIAAVARTATNIDAFWIGKDAANANATALWWANWDGSGWSTKEVPYTTDLAVLGANLTAVATAFDHLDVFFVGKDGGLKRSAWTTHSPGFLTTTVESSFAFSGARVSAVSTDPASIDVVAVAGNAVSRASMRNGTWAPVSSVAGPSPLAIPSALSIVAPDFGTLAVAFQDVAHKTYSATLPYSAPSWTTQRVADVAPVHGSELVDVGIQSFKVNGSVISVLDGTNELWQEPTAPGYSKWDIAPNVRDYDDRYTLLSNGNLWRDIESPVRMTQVDGNVASFQGLADGSTVYVKGTDGNLWRELGTMSNRTLVDGNVASFQALEDGWTVYVVGTDGNLWRETRSNALRTLVDRNVLAFQAIDTNEVYVLGTDRKLWHEFGSTRVRTLVDANVKRFAALAGNTVFVQGLDAKLWREVGDYTHRSYVGDQIMQFQPIDADHVYILGTDGRLWR